MINRNTYTLKIKLRALLELLFLHDSTFNSYNIFVIMKDGMHVSFYVILYGNTESTTYVLVFQRTVPVSCKCNQTLTVIKEFGIST